MEKKEYVGIDVSKSKLDVWLYYARKHKKFDNNEEGFKRLFYWVEEITGFKLNEVSFCFEHTGLYSLPLSLYLHKKQSCFFMVSGLLVKRSLGLKRGKNDKVDAYHLSHFAYLYRQELKPYQMPSETVIKLKQLQSFRARLVKQCSGYKSHLRELKEVLKPDNEDTLVSTSTELVKVLGEKIKVIEREIISLIKADEKLSDTYRNVTSIKGVGLVITVAMIASTNNFQSFDNYRQFACYTGIAPFEHQSGISYKGKSRISNLGNRALKTLLSNAAASAIQYNPEMRLYYQRRLKEGKSKMSTINIIRNKIVSRIFAVARRQTPYVDYCKYAI
jgi:transposase